MVTIRNPNMAHARTVIAGEAMKAGMLVKLVQAANSGDPCKVMKVDSTAAADPTVLKGIVTFIPDNDLAVEFILDPTNESLTLNTGEDNTTDIPLGALCVFWYGKPVVGLTAAELDSTLAVSAREGTKVAVNGTTSKIGTYASANADRDVYLGTVYQNEDGVALTIICDAL